MAERRYAGRPASPGLAMGPLHVLASRPDAAQAPAGDAAAEQERLDAALGQARDDLVALTATAGTAAEEVLAFQVELLGDPALVEDACAAIASGESAGAAWRAALDAQIKGYLAADDDYFRARAADLDDLKTRVIDLLEGRRPDDVPAVEGAILAGRELTPSAFVAAERARLAGVALAEGSAQSHVAMLARARGLPMVVDLGVIPAGADEAILDGEEGVLVTAPAPATRHAYAKACEARARTEERAAALLASPAMLPNGERVACLLNVDDPTAVNSALVDAADGVGLWRTEFLFSDRPTLPDETEQYAAYTALLDRLRGRPVTIRTLDVGGDKPLAGASLPNEANPFLGLRGLRLCLDRPELFRPQVRALLRAAPDRALKVMLPMVSRASELVEARSVFDGCLKELRAEGLEAAMPALGIMVETPASAIAIDTFDADFFSIGSNDLVQYTMAAARDAGGRVAALADPLDPAVQRLIQRVVDHGRVTGIEVSLCGDMAADPLAADRLLALGLRRFSVGPAALARLKLVVAEHGD